MSSGEETRDTRGGSDGPGGGQSEERLADHAAARTESSSSLVAEVTEDQEPDTSAMVPVPRPGTSCIEVIDGPQKRYYVLKNSRRQAYLRIDEKERFLWDQIDGRTSLNEIAERYYAEYQTLGFDRIGKLLHKLLDDGFVQPESVQLWEYEREQGPDSGERKTGGSSGLMSRLSFQAVGPKLGDRVFDSLDHLGFGFVGRPMALRLMAVLGLAGLAVFAHSLVAGGPGQILEALHPAGYYSLAFVGIYLWLAVGSAVHGLVRAAALKANGGDVIEARAAFRFGVLGLYVDVRDYQVLPVQKRRAILLSGVWAEMFVLGACGILSSSGTTALYQQLLALGALTIGLRLLFHVCPILNSAVYLAVAESFDIPHLRRAAMRFLRPNHWLRIWQKEEWDTQETVYFSYGLWTLLWAAVAAEIGSVLLRSQLSKTVVDLTDKALLRASELNADEIVALVMILLVFVPVVAFLIASVSYLVSSLSRVLPNLGVWKEPGKLLGTLTTVSLFVALVVWLSMGTGGESLTRLAVVLCGLYLAKTLYGALKDEADGLLSSDLTKAQALALAAAGVSLLGALAEALGYGIWPFLVGAGALFAVPSLLFSLRRGSPLLDSPFSGFGIASCAAMAGVAVSGIASIAQAHSGEARPGLWIGLNVGCGWLALTVSRGWWFLAHVQALRMPHFEYREVRDEQDVLREGCDYVLTSLLANLATYGGRSFGDRVRAGLQRSAQAQGLRLEVEGEGEIPRVRCVAQESGSTEQEAQGLRELVVGAISLGIPILGLKAMARLLESVLAHLPWDERQAVTRRVFRGTRWAPQFPESRDLSKSDRLRLLAGTFLFHRFDEDELAVIASIVSSRTYGAGEAIIIQDDEGDQAYVIQRGRVEVLVEDETGESHTVAQLAEGDFFGELALLEDAPRSATVKAIDEVAVLLLERPVFERSVERSGGAREKLSETVRALRLIQQMPLFEEFSSGEAATVATQFRMERFDKDEDVVTHGEIGGKFYVIQSGSADVVIPENGSEKVIGTLRPQDFFGEIGLLFEVPRTATVRATEPLTVFALNRTDFLELVGGNPFTRGRLSKVSEQRTRELEAVAGGVSAG